MSEYFLSSPIEVENSEKIQVKTLQKWYSQNLELKDDLYSLCDEMNTDQEFLGRIDSLYCKYLKANRRIV